MSAATAIYIKKAILANPSLVLGLATGSTPLGTYQELVRLHRKANLNFSGVTTFNLDEYIGLAADHPQSYRFFMDQNLFGKINLLPKNIYIPNGMAQDLEEHCRWYEQQIKRHGGIDLQILGIGRDGHIGFNEPGSPFDSRTRVVNLDEITIQDNARFFDSSKQVPHQAITMGLATIMEAREILFLANGTHKAKIVARALQGPVTPKVPASFLQKHPRLTAILDQEAASLVNKKT